MSISEMQNDCNRTPFTPTVSQKEPAISLKECYSMIWRGGYPKMVVRSDVNWDTFYKSYVTTYIERYVRDFVSVGDEIQFYKFVRAAAARIGQMLDYTDMAKDVRVSVPTIKA